MTYDLKIVNANIVDGSGEPGKPGSIGIKDGKIAALYDAPEDAVETIDAEGRVACPGFVDVHTHYDIQVLWDNFMSVSPWHGVTTAVLGNCGFGLAPTLPDHRDLLMRMLEKVEGMSIPAMKAGIGEEWPFETFPEYLEHVENKGIAINTAFFIGHSPIRLYVMGLDSVKREATQEEIEKMKALVREGVEAGALGFATAQVELHFGFDGNKTPSRLASLDEIDELLGAVADAGGVMNQMAPGQDMNIEFMGKMWDKHKLPMSWSALLADSPAPGAHHQKMEESLAQCERGAQITPQVSCRPVQFDFTFMEPYPFGAIDEWVPDMAVAMGGDKETKIRIYSDKGFRDLFKTLNEPGHTIYTNWEDRMVLSLNPLDPSTDGMLVKDAAAEAGKDAVDFMLDLTLETDFKARFRLAAVNYNEKEVEALLDHADKNAVIALSDAGAHADQLCDAAYPTCLLGQWVREKKTMSLERAVHMLTQHPAKVFGIKDRGSIDVGRPADVVIFDPETIGDSPLKRVYDQPAGQDRLISEATGIDYVIVNGTILRKHNVNQLTAEDQLPGRILRGGQAS